jgi:chromosome segregation ATPase
MGSEESLRTGETVMSSGVSVTGSAKINPADRDVNIAYGGGANFMARLQQLAEAKENADQAIAEMNLGRSAKEVMADLRGTVAAINDQLSQAETAVKEAQATLDAAREEAAATVRNAGEGAAEIRAQAKVELAAAKNEREAAVADRQALVAERQATEEMRGRHSDLVSKELTAIEILSKMVSRIEGALNEVGQTDPTVIAAAIEKLQNKYGLSH